MGTETATEHSNDKLTISPPSTTLSRWIGEQVTILAEAFGEPLTAARVRIYVGDLADLAQKDLAVAFDRARRELRYFPKISELRDLAGGNREQQEDAKARKAWDVLMAFVDKCVSSDVHGNYGPRLARNQPTLSPRILDAVRRTGGWRAYACLRNEDYPFLQKRFFQEFLVWQRVEGVEPSRMLAAAGLDGQFHRLAAGKRMSGTLPAVEPDEVPTSTDI